MRDFSFAHIPRPQIQIGIDWSRGPLDLEIGAGQGLHAIRYCQANPSRILLAIEKTHSRFSALQTRKDSHPQLENLHVFHADAVAFVSYLVPAASLDRVFLLYPNPYPKAKQSNLRWYNRPFTALLVEKMKPGAEFTLATNMEWYAEQAAKAMVQNWNLKLESRQSVDPAAQPRTHFEKKYLERKETCWNLVFRKG